MKFLDFPKPLHTYDEPKAIGEASPLRKEKEEQRQLLGYLSSAEYFLPSWKKKIAEAFQASGLASLATLQAEDIDLGPVPQKFTGDYAVKLPRLMQADMGSYTKEILPAITTVLSHNGTTLGIASFQSTGPFLNISVSAEYFVRAALSNILEHGQRYGLLDTYKGKNFCIDYSSPNMGKSLHVGHVTTTHLGQAMANVYEAAGYTVFRINHLGDWGTPVGLLKVGVEDFAHLPEMQALAHSPAKYFSALYAKVHELSKENPELRERAQAAFVKLEAGDAEMLTFWQDVRRRSVQELKAIYADCRIIFDSFIGEAAYLEDLHTAFPLIEKAPFVRQDGLARVVDFEAEKLGTVLLMKSDGGTTYITRDIVAIQRRQEVLGIHKSAYVVGTEQALHFRQLFEIAKRLNLAPEGSCVHIPVGLLTKNGKKISSRSGGAMSFEELVSDVQERCLLIAKESLPEEDKAEQEKIAAQVARAALYFSQTQNSPGKNSEFSVEDVTNTKGKSGPSLQYACVRAQSILNKIGLPAKSVAELSPETFENLDPSILKLSRMLVELPEIVASCAANDTAHYLANYLDELKMAFTDFIHAVVIREASGDLRELYLILIQASLQVMGNGLRILNIEIPTRM